MSDWIIAGDIGATKVNIACFRAQDGPMRPIKEARIPTDSAKNLENVINDFLHGNTGPVVGACFGVAGPVMDGRVTMPNAHWTVDERSVSRFLGGRPVRLLNDLVAMGHGLDLLPEDRFASLNVGQADPRGNGAIIAAGTGLGQALLVRDGAGWRAHPSEGGHIEFGPCTQIEIDMVRFFIEEFGRVSYDRLISGPGLHNLYRFFRDTGRAPQPEPAWLTERLANEDPGQVITEVAMSGENELCGIALGRFVKIYGGAAGNLALMFNATGGMFVGGGIAPKILEWLETGIFMQGFTGKGRMSGLLERIPVKVILEPKTPLYGAARAGFELAGVVYELKPPESPPGEEETAVAVSTDQVQGSQEANPPEGGDGEARSGGEEAGKESATPEGPAADEKTADARETDAGAGDKPVGESSETADDEEPKS